MQLVWLLKVLCSRCSSSHFQTVQRGRFCKGCWVHGWGLQDRLGRQEENRYAEIQQAEKIEIIICLKWRRSSYIFFCFPLQESSRNLKTSLFRTQRPWLASLICATALKLLPDRSRCQASTTIKQVSVVWGQSRPVPEGRRTRLMWFVPIKMMTPFYFFPFLRSGKSWIICLQSGKNLPSKRCSFVGDSIWHLCVWGDIQDDTPKWRA